MGCCNNYDMHWQIYLRIHIRRNVYMDNDHRNYFYMVYYICSSHHNHHNHNNDDGNDGNGYMGYT